jgi:hypothetical protein
LLYHHIFLAIKISSATAQATAALSNVPVGEILFTIFSNDLYNQYFNSLALGDPIMGAIRRLEDISSQSNTIGAEISIYRFSVFYDLFFQNPLISCRITMSIMSMEK